MYPNNNRLSQTSINIQEEEQAKQDKAQAEYDASQAKILEAQANARKALAIEAERQALAKREVRRQIREREFK